MGLFSSPEWYWILGLIVSIYQAIRGGILQHQFAKRQRASSEGTVGADNPLQLFFIRSLADAITYFAMTLSGFASLLLAYRLLESASSVEKLSAGPTAALIFLTVFGVLGVTGKLPDSYQHFLNKSLNL